ncbi:hypothetical protein CYLTODRAFT_419030, partial [Cylindrobasidium torrendii FP15055 ss-10]
MKDSTRMAKLLSNRRRGTRYFAIIPNEIVVQIAEAASAHTRTILLRVSKAVYAVVLPVLYQHVCISSADEKIFRNFCDALEGLNFERCVRSLRLVIDRAGMDENSAIWFEVLYGDDFLSPILEPLTTTTSSMPNLTSLYIHIDDIKGEQTYLRTASFPNLRHLVLSWRKSNIVHADLKAILSAHSTTLRTLSIQCDEPIHTPKDEAPLQGIDFPSLVYLSAPWNYFAAVAFTQPPMLESAEIDMNYQGVVYAEERILSRVPSLRTLRCIGSPSNLLTKEFRVQNAPASLTEYALCHRAVISLEDLWDVLCSGINSRTLKKLVLCASAAWLCYNPQIPGLLEERLKASSSNGLQDVELYGLAWSYSVDSGQWRAA